MATKNLAERKIFASLKIVCREIPIKISGQDEARTTTFRDFLVVQFNINRVLQNSTPLKTEILEEESETPEHQFKRCLYLYI